jgi:hypothetical protein
MTYHRLLTQRHIGLLLEKYSPSLCGSAWFIRTGSHSIRLHLCQVLSGCPAVDASTVLSMARRAYMWPVVQHTARRGCANGQGAGKVMHSNYVAPVAQHMHVFLRAGYEEVCRSIEMHCYGQVFMKTSSSHGLDTTMTAIRQDHSPK